MTISDQLRIACSNQCIELIDAKKGVFVRGVAVKKFMLYQTGQLAKLRNITAEIIDPVHETERAADLAFPGQDLLENFARRCGLAIRAGDLAECTAGWILLLRAKIEV